MWLTFYGIKRATQPLGYAGYPDNSFNTAKSANSQLLRKQATIAQSAKDREDANACP